MKFNWMNLLGAIPYVVMGIQHMHAEAPGATKKQLAMQALGLATATAETAATDPATQQAVDTLGKSAGAVIDATVSMFHSQNAPGFGNASTKAA